MVSIDAAVKLNIKEFGWHMQGVYPHVGEKNPQPAFHYTVGLSNHVGVELLCIGSFPPPLIATALNTMGSMFVANKALGIETPREGEFDLGWTVPVKLRKCGPEADMYWSRLIKHFVKGPWDTVQVLLQDKNGVYQDDPKCAYGQAALP